jgi:hypothetical protein
MAIMEKFCTFYNITEGTNELGSNGLSALTETLIKGTTAKENPAMTWLRLSLK